MPRPLSTLGKVPVPIVQEAGWAVGSVWTGAENLASTGIRSPDRPARSQSLYRLSYPAGAIEFYRPSNKFITNKLHELRIQTLLYVSNVVFSHLQGVSCIRRLVLKPLEDV
jgi:hypothetical protein